MNSSADIAALYDKLRQQAGLGRILGINMRCVITRGVSDLCGGPQSIAVIDLLRMVGNYTYFNPEENDPYDEHDFGSFRFKNKDIFWKIESFEDSTCQYGAENKLDAKACHVLTIMLAEEY